MKTATVTIHANCPYCGFSINALTPETIAVNSDKYDNGHDGGRGGFRSSCESCGKPFVVEAAAVHDVQHVALIMLGEA